MRMKNKIGLIGVWVVGSLFAQSPSKEIKPSEDISFQEALLNIKEHAQELKLTESLNLSKIKIQKNKTQKLRKL